MVAESEAFPSIVHLIFNGVAKMLQRLKILQVIMHKIKWDKQLDETPLPCDYFDLIGGTSTGGIISILLGRLRLSVEDCLDIYASLSRKVFKNERFGKGFFQSKFDHTILEEVIKIELKKIKKRTRRHETGQDVPLGGGDSDGEEPSGVPTDSASHIRVRPRRPGSPDIQEGIEARMLDTYDRACKAFVSATPGIDVQRDQPKLFRTYQSRETNAVPDCKIWEAIRATSAAPTFFDSITINDLTYVDGGFGCNNPCIEVYEEARKIWPNREIGVILSLGTGMPKVLSIDNPSYFDQWWPRPWVQVLERIATQCDATHQEMYRKRELRGKYFRFNVQQGLQSVSLAEWDKLGEVGTHTEQYMRDADIVPKLNQAVECILAVETDPGVGTDDEEQQEPPSYSRAISLYR